jgi:hypothetical protein
MLDSRTNRNILLIMLLLALLFLGLGSMTSQEIESFLSSNQPSVWNAKQCGADWNPEHTHTLYGPDPNNKNKLDMVQYSQKENRKSSLVNYKFFTKK